MSLEEQGKDKGREAVGALALGPLGLAWLGTLGDGVPFAPIPHLAKLVGSMSV